MVAFYLSDEMSLVFLAIWIFLFFLIETKPSVYSESRRIVQFCSCSGGVVYSHRTSIVAPPRSPWASSGTLSTSGDLFQLACLDPLQNPCFLLAVSHAWLRKDLPSFCILSLPYSSSLLFSDGTRIRCHLSFPTLNSQLCKSQIFGGFVGFFTRVRADLYT